MEAGERKIKHKYYFNVSRFTEYFFYDHVIWLRTFLLACVKSDESYRLYMFLTQNKKENNFEWLNYHPDSSCETCQLKQVLAYLEV